MQKFLFFSLLFFVSCSSNNIQYKKAENAFDAGREFIDGTLKGDFKKATFYMLLDSANQQFLANQENDFRLKDKEGRQQFRTASINIQQVEDIDSTESIIHYNNSFDKKEQFVKVIKQNNNWVVDYKYSFQRKLVH
jgi:hypothetical protein